MSLVRKTKLRSTIFGFEKSKLIFTVGGVLLFLLLSLIYKINAQMIEIKTAKETEEIIQNISFLEEVTSILYKILIFLVSILILCFYINHEPLFEIIIKSICVIGLIYLSIDYADLTFKVSRARSENLLTTGFKLLLVLALFIYVGFTLYIIFNQEPIA